MTEPTPSGRWAPPLQRGGAWRWRGAVCAVVLLASCAALGVGVDARLVLAEESATLPMQLDDGVPLVDVRIAGKGPFLFKLDTGSGPSVISDRLAARLQLPLQRVRGTLSGANGKTRAIDRVASAPSLQLADGVRLSDLRLIVLPAEDLDVHGARRPVEGILGFALFTSCTLTLDYPRKVLVLSRAPLDGSPQPGSPPSGSPPEQAVTVDLPLRVVSNTPHVEIEVGGQPLDVLVDTGNDQGLIVDTEDGARLSFVAAPTDGPLLSTVSGMTRVHVGRLQGDILIGSHRVQQPLISVMPCKGAMLGAEVLRYFKITLDAGRKQARFVRADDRPVTVESRLTDGLGLRRLAQGWLVIDVIPNSPADAAGVRVGDAVRAIEYVGEGQYRIEVGQHGVFREVVLKATVLVK